MFGERKSDSEEDEEEYGKGNETENIKDMESSNCAKVSTYPPSYAQSDLNHPDAAFRAPKSRS